VNIFQDRSKDHCFDADTTVSEYRPIAQIRVTVNPDRADIADEDYKAVSLFSFDMETPVLHEFPLRGEK
jgi:hypothetical protein